VDTRFGRNVDTLLDALLFMDDRVLLLDLCIVEVLIHSRKIGLINSHSLNVKLLI